MTGTPAGISNLLRLHTAGFEGFAFVLGPLIGGWPGSWSKFAELWLIGVLLNGHIFALNDLVDLPADRNNPARTRSPLVTGLVSERSAVAYATALPLAATGVTVLAKWPVTAQSSFVLVLILAVFVNVFQKVTRRPLVMDVLFAVTMAAPLPVATEAMLNRVPTLVWSATVLMFLACLELNSIAGNLKDLRADQRTAARTVALNLGADIGDGGTVIAGARYKIYCWALHGATIVASLATVFLASTDSALPLPLSIAALAVTGLICWWGAVSLHRLLAGSRIPSPRGREAYFASGMAALLIAMLIRAPWRPLLAAVVLLAAWELVFAMARSRRRNSHIGQLIDHQQPI